MCVTVCCTCVCILGTTLYTYSVCVFATVWMQQINPFHFPRTHVTAAIIHGQGTYAYIDVHAWPHDSNLTINILLNILMKQEFLPPVLYLQLDNTARENKNQYILSFLSYLVQMRIFSEVSIILSCETKIVCTHYVLHNIILLLQIQLSFLMVGHTHEDVDQVFSRISTYLRQNSVYTLSGSYK